MLTVSGTAILDVSNEFIVLDDFQKELELTFSDEGSVIDTEEEEEEGKELACR